MLDTAGYQYDDESVGVLALKEMLLLARRLGITTQGMDENGSFGDGTLKAVNQVLKKGGYVQNGIAGEGFVKYLASLIKAKVYFHKKSGRMSRPLICAFYDDISLRICRFR